VLRRAIVITEKTTDAETATKRTIPRLTSDTVDEFVAEPLMRPLPVVEVDNSTPIILSGEKSVIHGIPGSVALWPSTRCASSTGNRYVTAVLKRIGRVES
jgi:hypothetical protein